MCRLGEGGFGVCYKWYLDQWGELDFGDYWVFDNNGVEVDAMVNLNNFLLVPTAISIVL